MVGAALVLAATGASCTGDDDDDAVPDTVAAEAAAAPSLPLADLPAAVAAVEDDRGGPQRYTEINVGPDLVNVFVALDDGTELAYVYRGGQLEPPPGPTAQPEGAVLFDLTGVDLELPEGFDDLLAPELPDSVLVGVSLAAAGGGGAQWTATMLGSKGSVFDVLISPAGAIVGALPR